MGGIQGWKCRVMEERYRCIGGELNDIFIFTNVNDITNRVSFPGRLARQFVPLEVLLSLPFLSLNHRPPSQSGDYLLHFCQALPLQSLRVHTGLVQRSYILHYLEIIELINNIPVKIVTGITFIDFWFFTFIFFFEQFPQVLVQLIFKGRHSSLNSDSKKYGSYCKKQG